MYGTLGENAVNTDNLFVAERPRLDKVHSVNANNNSGGDESLSKHS